MYKENLKIDSRQWKGKGRKKKSKQGKYSSFSLLFPSLDFQDGKSLTPLSLLSFPSSSTPRCPFFFPTFPPSPILPPLYSYYNVKSLKVRKTEERERERGYRQSSSGEWYLLLHEQLVRLLVVSEFSHGDDNTFSHSLLYASNGKTSESASLSLSLCLCI